MILKKLLGEIMAEMGFVTKKQLREALSIQRKKIEEINNVEKILNCP